MPARRFLLALHQESDPAGELAERLPVGLDHLQPEQQVPLVVGDAPRVQPPIAEGWLVGRAGPELDRVGRLDVVVLDADQRSAARAGLSHDDGRSAFSAVVLDRLDREPGRAKPVGRPCGRASQLVEPAGLRWDAAEVTQLVDPAVAPLVDQLVEGVARHPRIVSRPERSRLAPDPQRIDWAIAMTDCFGSADSIR
jgi:hypothetical protein